MSVKLGNTNIAGTQVLYSTTGNNTDGAMTQAVTTAQLSLKANDADVVHLTGNETITGVKSYLAMPALIFSSEIRGTAPSSAIYGGIAFLDNNGERMAILEKDHLTNGSISLNIRAANPTTTGTASQATLGVTYPMSGNPYATAPASDVNGSIVTTVNKSKSSNGYLQLGNGIIIQWGRFQNTNNNFSVTFPKSFSNTNYSVSVGQVDSQRSADHNISINARNTTGFTGWISCNSTSLYSFWIAVGY